MSFVLPTSNIVVDKYQPERPADILPYHRLISGSLLSMISKYETFRQVITIADMEGVLNDPQSNLTLFVPLDLIIEKKVLKSCVGANKIEEKIVFDLDLNTARNLIDSLIVPGTLTCTMMIQSGMSRFKTRHSANTLTISSNQCVQLKKTYSKPPFDIFLNNKARIIKPDIKASNGMVQVIDQLPFKFYASNGMVQLPF